MAKKAPTKKKTTAAPKAKQEAKQVEGELLDADRAGNEYDSAAFSRLFQDHDPFPTEATSEGQTGTEATTDVAGSDGSTREASETPLATNAETKNDAGDVAIVDGVVDSFPGAELLSSSSRARLSGEKKHEYWERMRKAARLAGLPRGQGVGTAYCWATEQTDREFPPSAPIVEDPEPELPTVGTTPEPASIPVAPAPIQDDQGVSGLSDLPANWPELPANAQLQVEIAWVTANRLRVRDGIGVNLSKALSPAPSYSALSWLETSILFPAKFADISVKATASQDDEREHIRREKMSIEEIRGILAEMLD